MSVNQTGTGSIPPYVTGTFTSASSAADVTETIGFSPSIVEIWINISGTNPDMIVATSAYATDAMLTTGSTGVITTPAVASGITITSTGFTVPAGVQTNSGVNFWRACR
jgi:hypothetical protein